MTVAIRSWTHSFGIISLAVSLSPGQKFAANEVHGTVNGFLTKPDLCLRLQCVRCPTRIHLRGKGGGNLKILGSKYRPQGPQVLAAAIQN